MIMCKPVNQVWDQAVNRSFCTFAVPGLFSIWLCHLFTGFMLFLLLIVVSWFHDAFSPVRIETDTTAVAPPAAPVVLMQTHQGYEMVAAVPVEEVAPAAVQYANESAKPSDGSHRMEDHSHHAASNHSQHSHHAHQHHHQDNNDHHHHHSPRDKEVVVVSAEDDNNYAL